MLGLGNSITYNAPLYDDAFTPEGLSSAIHFWRADVGVEESDGSFPEDGEQVTKWRDQVGSEHATASSDFPTYNTSETALEMDGAGKQLVLPSGDVSLSGDFSIWVRVKFDSISNDDKFLIDSSNASMFWRVTNNTTSRLKVAAGGGGNNDFTLPSTLSTGVNFNIAIQRSGSDLRLYLDGVESTTGALSETNTVTFDRIKGSLSDKFQALLVCNSALSVTERSNMNTWLDDNL
tara:strand:- start:53 stop:754 length:702 start_codon:yes stop_codon:yes gene_type:complete